MCPSPFYGYTEHGEINLPKNIRFSLIWRADSIMVKQLISLQIIKTGYEGYREEGDCSPIS